MQSYPPKAGGRTISGPGQAGKEGRMIFICIVMVAIAAPVFMLVSGSDRKRKRQNPHPYVAETPRKDRAPDLD